MTKAKRDNKGRFGSGNPGKPKGAKMKRPTIQSLRESFNSVISDADLARTWEIVRELAFEQKDLNAIRYLQDRGWGRDTNAGRGIVALDLPESMATSKDLASAVCVAFLAALRGDYPSEELSKLAAFAGRAGEAVDREDLIKEVAALRAELDRMREVG